MNRSTKLALIGIVVCVARPLSADVQYIYTSDQQAGELQRECQSFVSGLDSPQGIALDLSAGKIYWASDFGAKISVANLDGSGQLDLVTQGLEHPHGIALDLANGHMYFSDARDADTNDRIWRANLDGTSPMPILTAGADFSGVALDVAAGKIYWVDYTPRVARANLDGSGVETLINGDVDLPNGIALDLTAGKMYWTDQGLHSISRANLDGSQRQDLVESLGNVVHIALDLDSSEMYWTDHYLGKVQRANLDGTNVQDVCTGLADPYGIALVLGSPVPAVSSWGLGIMVLLIVTAGTLVILRKMIGSRCVDLRRTTS